MVCRLDWPIGFSILLYGRILLGRTAVFPPLAISVENHYSGLHSAWLIGFSILPAIWIFHFVAWMYFTTENHRFSTNRGFRGKTINFCMAEKSVVKEKKVPDFEYVTFHSKQWLPSASPDFRKKMSWIADLFTNQKTVFRFSESALALSKSSSLWRLPMAVLDWFC